MEIMMELIMRNGACVVLFIGIMAFVVSCMAEVLKHVKWLDKHVPTAATVIVLSLILCPVAISGLAHYYKIVLDWYLAFGSFIAAFVVALVSMDGWEKVYELKERFVKKIQG